LAIAAFEAQPAGLTPIQAMRGAMHAVFTSIPPEELAKQWERGKLILSVPELRLRFWDQVADLGSGGGRDSTAGRADGEARWAARGRSRRANLRGRHSRR
jgi:hypothetical protein